MGNYNAQSPVLFLLFNRPGKTQRVFDRIKQAAPSKLYIAADGPRNDKPADQQLCEETRAIINLIDWSCEVKTLFNDHNKGCRLAVSDAITWFFNHEERGIILEDDCLPSPDFFKFCDTLLDYYRNDTRIHTITGTNLQMGIKHGDASYYFSRYSNIWGWASWRRVWNKYDRDLIQYDEKDVEEQMRKIFTDKFLITDWTLNFKKLKAGEIDTWDHQLNFLTFFENALCVTPNVNLITNIGFDTDATHTFSTTNPHANLPTEVLGEITHPEYFLPTPEADHYFLEKEHNLKERWRIYNKRKNRLRRWIKQVFKPVDNH